MATSAGPAEAKRRLRGGGYTPPYASIVVDAKTGRVLQATDENAPRHPASVTKVMTLYLLFEQLESGKLSMDSPLRVSANAAAQAPSKLGLAPGSTIAVEDAIKALVTKSANDIAVTVAENLGGSEEDFAETMTRRARMLGMSRTSFRNASGLPNPGQITTARDLSTLARAVQERFPQYYPVFATRTFFYRGGSYKNHNRLLGRIEGVDGIKTGYVRASGFNLMTSAKRDGRHVVAVVLGGRTGAERDRSVARLIEAHIDEASTGPRTAPAVAARERARPAVVAEASEAGYGKPIPLTTSSIGAVPAEAARAYAPTTTPSALSWLSASAPKPRPSALDTSDDAEVAAREALRPERPVPLAAVKPLPKATRAALPRAGEDAAEEASASSKAFTGRAPSAVRPSAAKPEPKPEPVRVAAKRDDEDEAPRAKPVAASAASASASASGWVIQLGAVDDAVKAKAMLARAKLAGPRVLAKAEPMTMKVTKGGSTLWRARFAGFEAEGAEAACRKLKRSGFACFATRG